MDIKDVFHAYEKYYSNIDGARLTDVNQIGPLGDALLHYAVRDDDVAAIAVLLDNGADINIAGDIGNTPLHDAARLGKIAIVELLLKRGANVYAKNEFEESPVDIARNKDYVDVANVLRLYMGQ